MDDWNLLQEYVRQGSSEALDELVRRYVGMVYAAALRQVGDADLAEDVTQAVFLVLMRRAPHLSQRVVLGGWLFNVTRFASAKERRGRQRRQYHEREAATMRPERAEPDRSADSRPLDPLLDDALGSLSRADRDAVVMKYLLGKSHREIADALHTTEGNARQRIFRSLGKLRSILQRKGMPVAEESLDGVLLGMAGLQSRPLNLAKRIADALLNAPASTGASSAIATSVVRKLVMSKIKTAVAASLVLLMVGGAASVTILYAVSTPPPPTPASAVPHQETSPVTTPDRPNRPDRPRVP